MYSSQPRYKLGRFRKKSSSSSLSSQIPKRQAKRKTPKPKKGSLEGTSIVQEKKNKTNKNDTDIHSDANFTSAQAGSDRKFMEYKSKSSISKKRSSSTSMSNMHESKKKKQE